jgi:hypothetical protein
MVSGLSIGDIAVLLAVGGTATYIMGVVAIAWPIYTRITNDVVVTWHAVALIPRTLVVGLGVRILFTFPLVVTPVVILTFTLVGLYQSLRDTLFGSSIIIIVASDVALAFVVAWMGFWALRRRGIRGLFVLESHNPVPRALKYVSYGLGYSLVISSGALLVGGDCTQSGKESFHKSLYKETGSSRV